MADLHPATVAARIESLRGIDLRARPQPPGRPAVSMTPAAIEQRLNELRALLELTSELQRARPTSD